MVESNIYDIDSIISYQLRYFVKFTTIPKEDLQQIAYMGYLKALKNADRRITYTYVVACIRNELRRAMRKEYNYSTRHLLTDEEGVLEHTPEPNVTDSPLIKQLENMLEYLEPVTAKVVKAMYFNPKPATLRQLAKELNISKSRVFQLKEAGLKKLREMNEQT